MVRFLACFATLVFATSLATADDHVPRSAGAKGTVTAWDESTTRVLEHRYCVRTRYSWNYATCSSRLRDDVKRRLCVARGPGIHRYLYQMGDSKPMMSTVLCRKP